MSLLTWGDSLSVGVKLIDEQHQKMFSIINTLYDLMKNSVRPPLEETIRELVEYADYHFKTEEALFAKVDFEEMASHIEHHNEYRNRITDFIQKHGKNQEFLSYEILDYLEDWWIKHISSEDKKYTKILNEHGVF
jgi:hemerythrin-like metal-binding protein